MNRPALGAEVGAGDHHHAHAIAHHVVDFRQVLQGDFALALEDLVDVIEAGGRADVPLLDVADALGMFQPGGGHQGDVAEGSAAEIGQNRPVALAVEPLRLGGEILQVGVGDGAELLQVVLRIEADLVDRLLANDRSRSRTRPWASARWGARSGRLPDT